MKEAENPRLIMVGSVTGNDNTVGGGGVYPIADLKDLAGLAQGAKEPIAMIDGFNFNGAKAYKDTKMCLMMTSNTLHDRFHRSTGVAFSAIYPGCIAESPLFREKRPWFRKFFPVFMKYVTGGFVGEVEAGQRLGQVLQSNLFIVLCLIREHFSHPSLSSHRTIHGTYHSPKANQSDIS